MKLTGILGRLWDRLLYGSEGPQVPPPPKFPKAPISPFPNAAFLVPDDLRDRRQKAVQMLQGGATIIEVVTATKISPSIVRAIAATLPKKTTNTGTR